LYAVTAWREKTLEELGKFLRRFFPVYASFLESHPFPRLVIAKDETPYGLP
jgi:hypothetical protein